MNITIYYLSKKITLQQIDQSTQNQSFINIDDLTKNELVEKFTKFAQQTQQIHLTFVTKSITDALEKFREPFKYIYAAGGLIENENKYLFIFRLKCWDLPKGKLEKGELPNDAAIRECEEECGITKLTITQELEPTYHMYDYKGGYALKKTYWYAMTTEHTGELIPQLEENIEKVEWFTKAQINEIVVPNSYPAILNVIKHLIN